MKTLKKSLAVFMAMLMLVSGFAMGASAGDPEITTVTVKVTADEEHKSAKATIDGTDTYTNINYTINPSDGVGSDNETEAMKGFFWNLTPGVKYTVTATCTVNGSSAGTGTTDFAIKKTVEIPEKITVTDIKDGEITVDRIANENDVYYIAAKGTPAPTDEKYDTDTTFDNLSKGVTYTVWAKVKGDELIKESDVLTVDVTTGITPDVMVVTAAFDRATMSADVSYNAMPGYSYDSVKYSVTPAEGVSNTDGHFTGLKADTTYAFTVEAILNSGSTVLKAAGSQEIKVKKIQKAPSAVTESEITATTVTLKPIANAEYSKDGFNFQDKNVFEGLTPDSWYTFYARYKATDAEYESDAVASNKIRTNIAAETEKPAKPKIKEISDTSLTLVKTENYEYSIDNGKTWQSSEIFKSLTANTAYKVVQRKKAVERQDINPSSDTVTIKTSSRAPVVANPANGKFEITSRDGIAYKEDPVSVSVSDIIATNASPVWGDTNLIPTAIHYQCGSDAGDVVVTSNKATFTPKEKGTYTLTVKYAQMKYVDVDNGDGTVSYKFAPTSEITTKTVTVSVGDKFSQAKIIFQKVMSFLLTTIPNAILKMGNIFNAIKKMFQGAV